MQSRPIAFLLAAAGLAAAASGQAITTPGITATLSMDWIEDPAFVHNDNGILEPGEHALIRTSLSFSNQYQWVDFAPAVGTYSSGIVIGLGSTYVDIRSASADPSGLYNNGITVPPSASVGPNANSAGTSGYGVRQPFRIAGNVSNGNPVASGFINVQAGQTGNLNNGVLINFTDPIANIDRLGWAPNDYTARTANFAISAAVGAGLDVLGLLVDLDGTTDGTQAGYVQGNTYTYAYIPVSQITFGSVNIPIVPAPAGCALLGIAGLIASRRRVRAPWESST